MMYLFYIHEQDLCSWVQSEKALNWLVIVLATTLYSCVNYEIIRGMGYRKYGGDLSINLQ